MQNAMIDQAKALLADGTVARVVGWKRGELSYDVTPAVFETPEALDENFLYDDFCGANLSKYLIKESQKTGKTLAFLKACDTYSFNQLVKEHRIQRDNVYVIGIPCEGKIDPERVIAAGAAGATEMISDGTTVKSQTLYGEKTVAKQDVLAERCASCKSRKHAVYDKLLGDEGEVRDSGRFDMVEKLEAMSSDERFEFWRGELSRCIRCNACRNVCPACTCLECVFDNAASGIANKSAPDSFEENMFHIIRAFHVAGRCTDCGECSRACPQGIPLHLLNRKFIKDINEIYGEFQAGADAEALSPITAYDLNDVEPSVVYRRGGENN
jgi:formate dehydrogenase subunit beta